MDAIGSTQFEVDGSPFDLEIVDSTDDYFALMKTIFDFDAIKNYLNTSQRVSLLNSLQRVSITPETYVAITTESCVAIKPIARKKLCGNYF